MRDVGACTFAAVPGLPTVALESSSDVDRVGSVVHGHVTKLVRVVPVVEWARAKVVKLVSGRHSQKRVVTWGDIPVAALIFVRLGACG